MFTVSAAVTGAVHSALPLTRRPPDWKKQPPEVVHPLAFEVRGSEKIVTSCGAEVGVTVGLAAVAEASRVAVTFAAAVAVAVVETPVVLELIPAEGGPEGCPCPVR